MKNRLLKTFVILGVTVVGSTSLTACGKKENDVNVLNIVCLNKGYGRAWIDELKTIWEAEHEGYTINLTAVAAADDLIKKHIYDSDNIDDLYIGNSKEWKTYASQNKFLELDSFLDEDVDGKTVREKINDEYEKSIIYNGHTYRLPWTSGIPGIYYNSKMFEKNGWEIPQTTDELKALCTTIVDSHIKIDPYGPSMDSNWVKPFILSNQLYYSDYAVFTWWGQLAGIDAVQEYLKYESADTFSSSANPTCAKLGEALQIWTDLIGDKSNIVDKSETYEFGLAQQSFFQGQAAMMFNSDWIYNEILSYTDTGKFGDDFDIKIMKTPVATGAIDPHASYIVGEDNYIAIPKSTIKADLAKSFIKLMISDRGIAIFAEKAHGTLAYESTSSITTENEYTNSLIEYLDNATHRFTNWSNSKLFLKNVLDIWSYKDMQPYSRILNKTNPITCEAYMNLLASNARNKWDQWVKEAGGI